MPALIGSSQGRPEKIHGVVTRSVPARSVASRTKMAPWPMAGRTESCRRCVGGAGTAVEVVEAQEADPRGGLRIEHDEKASQAVLGRHGVIVQQAAS
jgi:hypothetical protein